MKIAFSACLRDESIAVQTLEWARQLDGKLDYDCILSIGDGVKGWAIIEAAQKLFRNVIAIEPHAPDSWPQGKNATFQHLVRYLDEKKNTESFLWIEPDSIFTKKGAIRTIEEAHIYGGKPFSGYIHESLNQMECVGVYPHNFMAIAGANGMLCRAAPWDQCAKREMAPNATKLNHLMQFIHDVDGVPPTFPKDSGILRKETVLFHASKDSSLVEQLSKGKIHKLVQFFKGDKKEEIKKDSPVAVYLCVEPSPPFLHNRERGKALLAIPSNAHLSVVGQWMNVLSPRYDVVRFMYPAAPIKEDECKWARKRVEEYMSKQSAPWVFA